MRASLGLRAGPAHAAGVRSVSGLAIDGLREAQRGQLFADALVAVEEIGMGDAIVTQRRLQDSLRTLVTDDIVKGHGL
jgi:hypothetical protein